MATAADWGATVLESDSGSSNGELILTSEEVNEQIFKVAKKGNYKENTSKDLLNTALYIFDTLIVRSWEFTRYLLNNKNF